MLMSSCFNNSIRNLKPQKLLDFEIKELQDKLASFAMDDVLSKRVSFSIDQAKDKSSIDPEMTKLLS